MCAGFSLIHRRLATKKKCDALDLGEARQNRKGAEDMRLAYIAMTHSKEKTVFATTEKRLDGHAPLKSTPVKFVDESGAPVSEEVQADLKTHGGSTTHKKEAEEQQQEEP